MMGAGGPKGTIDPVIDHVQEVAPTGCAVWRGELYYGSYLEGAIRRLDLPPGTDPRPVPVGLVGEPVYDLTVGPDDRLYVSSPSGIWRIAAPPTGTVSVPPSVSAGPPSSRWRWFWVTLAIALALVLTVRLARRAPAGPSDH